MHISNMCKNDLLKKRFPTWKLKLEEVVGTKEVQTFVSTADNFFQMITHVPGSYGEKKKRKNQLYK